MIDDSTLPLELTDRERELILKHSLAPDELTRLLRIVPAPERPAIVRYTLEDLDLLGGYIASESNHSKGKLHKECHNIFIKIWAILESSRWREAGRRRKTIVCPRLRAR